VIDNTALKFVYRINDGEYAESLAKAAGRQRTFVEATTKGVSDDTGHGGWSEQHIQYLNPDLLTHLPLPSDRPGQASTGVLLGWGNASLFYVGPMDATGDMPMPVEEPKACAVVGMEAPI
jgi:hypothetical protein